MQKRRPAETEGKRDLPEITAETVKAEAGRLGFDLCRIAALGEAPHADFFEAWIGAGRSGEMAYLTRHREKRRRPALLAEPGDPAFRSLVVLGVDYHQFDLPPDVIQDPSRGIVASYAWGADYHEILRPLLQELDAFVRTGSGRRSHAKCLVDTGPVLERDWALQAGLGFTGKNCCTIHPGRGSWLFLATVLLPERLAPDPPPPPSGPSRITASQVLSGLAADTDFPAWPMPSASGRDLLATCGRCTRCLDGCPTQSFRGPFHLDPLRCISYWTIESRSSVPRALRPLFGNRIFGCDICQEVCPWNRRLPPGRPRLPGLQARTQWVAPYLLEGFLPRSPYWLKEDAFRERFRASPIRRARRSGMARNVCIALGNWGHPRTVPALELALADPDPLVREHAAWALGRVARHQSDDRAVELLAGGLEAESDHRVREEIRLALG